MTSSRSLILYKQLLREASKFPSYIYRTYALRRIKDAFRENKSLSNQSALESVHNFAEENLNIIKRQVVLGQMYRTSETVIERISKNIGMFIKHLLTSTRRSQSYIRFNSSLFWNAGILETVGAEFVLQRRFAGHSHWQNVRHIKAAKDANKAKQTDKYVRLIETAVQKGGGPDPKLNRLLQNAIDQAKRTQVVGNTAIEAAIKRASGKDRRQDLKHLLQEVVGDKGVLMLLDCETPHQSKFVHDLRTICKKHKYFILGKSGVKDKFYIKGFVLVDGRDDGKPLDADVALEAAIDGGAEEVEEIQNGEHKSLEFLCDAEDPFRLAKILSNSGYQVSEAGTRYIPYSYVDVDEEFLEKVGAFCDELEDHPDVQNVFTNIS